MKHAITVNIDINSLLTSLDLVQEKSKFYLIGKNILENQKNSIDQSLEKYRDENGYIDASLLEEDWFPQINTDIFISHSHNDEENVLIFAGMINVFFDKICFIDSCCWNHCNVLTKNLEDFYLLQNNKKAYENVKSHVYMILSVALSKMISNTECLMFFKTPSSISLSNGIEEYTSSPWIYSEIQTANIILDIYDKSKKLIEQTSKLRQFSIKYPTKTNRFLKMNTKNFLIWYNGNTNSDNALPELYQQLTVEKNIRKFTKQRI